MTSTSSQPYKLKRIVLRAFIGIAFMGFLGALGSIVFLDSLARTIVSASLSNAGIHLERLEGLRLRSAYIALDRVDFRVNNSAESSYIENLTVHFNWRELLKGQVRDLHIESLTLALPSQSTQQNTEPAAGATSFPSISEIRQQLESVPLDSLIIESLTISPFLESAVARLQRQTDSFQFDLLTPTSQLGLTLHWQDELPLENPSTVTGTLTLSDAQRQALDIEFTLEEQNTLLSLATTVHLKAELIQALLAAHGLYSYDFAMLNGDFNFDLFVALNAAPEQGFDFDLRAPALQSLSIQFADDNPLAMSSIQWLNNADITLAGSIAWAGPRLTITANSPDGQLVLTPAQSAPSTIAFDISPFTLSCNNLSQCTGSLTSSVRLDTFAAEQVHAQGLLAVSDIVFNIEPEQTQLRFAQGSRIEVGSIELADITLLSANALAQDSFELALKDNGDWQFASDAIDLFVPDLISTEKSTHFAIALHRLQGSVGTTSGTGLQLESDLQFRDIGSDWFPFSLRKTEANFNINVSEENLSLQGNVSLAEREILQLEAQWGLLENTGALQASIPTLRFTPGSQSLSQFFFRPPFNADLIGGTLHGSAALQVHQNNALNWLVSGPITLHASSLSGFYEDVGIINLSTSLEGDLIASSDFKSAPDQKFSIERIDVGLPVEDIMFNYTIDTQKTLFAIDAFEATLFRGAVRSNSAHYDWSASRNEAEITIERLDLARMLDLAAYDAVQATGFISGTLPLSLTDYSPSIDQGYLHVEAPGGTIRYSAIGGSNGSNAALNFVNQALNNYQYDLMETTVDYQPTGELDLGVRLQGLNPDMNNGQRINLNLNISDNIPALLQSLQSGRSIADALERALQRQ